jgi:hypothetical protein
VKRSIVAVVVVVLLLLAALTIWGNRLLSSSLDAKLAPLLSKQLGLPVQLAPISAHVLQLTARSPKLVMGQSADPAVVATDVVVTLAWPDLLHGEIQLVTASAADLMVRPSRWPDGDGPAPHDYRFLDQWIPRDVQVKLGRYVSDEGDAYPLNALHWQRQAAGAAQATWGEDRAAGKVAVQANLHSLPDLLRLAPVQLDLTLGLAGKPDSTIAVHAAVAPATAAAYSMQLDIDAADMTAHIATEGQTRWQLPDKADITIPRLETTRVQALLASYSASGEAEPLDDQLDAAVPLLQLPTLHGHAVIEELRVADEISQDLAFDFATSDKGVQISDLSAHGPTSVIHGELGIVSDPQGWAVKADASMQASDSTGTIATPFTGSHWLWRNGRAQLYGSGDTWGNLLNSLQGDVSLQGHYQSKVQLPLSIDARLDNRPGEFALDQLTIVLGEGRLSGTAALSGSEQRTLTADLQGARLDLGFLFGIEDDEPLPGIAVPEYLGAWPGLDLNLKVAVDGLQTPALSLGQASATLERTAQGGKLVATAKGTQHGTLALTLEASTPPNQPGDFKFTAQFDDLDIPGMFRQQGVFYSRSSGSLDFTSRAQGIENIFQAMQGAAKLRVTVRSDNNWQRPSKAQEELSFTGNSQLVIDKHRIVGVKIDKLAIDSIEQNLTGSVSLVAGRSPWFIAKLESQRLDISNLLALLPETADKADDAELLPSLKRLGAVEASLQAKSLRLYDMPLSDVHLVVSCIPDTLTVKQFDFVTDEGSMTSQGKISWNRTRANLDLNAQVSNIDLDQFLISSAAGAHVPVSGTARLASDGSTVQELLSNMTGEIDLQGSAAQPGTSTLARRALSLKATRLEDGVQADIVQLLWGESKLSGSVRYHRTTPPSLEIAVTGGTLSLLPWEKAYLKTKKQQASDKRGAALGSAAKASADFVSNLLLAPLRFLADEDESPPGEKLFSTEPLPLDALNEFNVQFSGQLDSLLSTEITASQIQFNGSISNGKLAVQAGSGQLSDGKGEFKLTVDSTAMPPAFELNSTFDNVKGLTAQETYPRSGFVALSSKGKSQADIAANTNGLVYLEFGKGPFDYANSAMLTANLSIQIFRTLIPGIEKQKPQIECGVTVAVFEDGKGVTPYGFAARTNQANLLGRLHVDLEKETMLMTLDSRGRQGVGLSVGSIFSNTVQIKGPLTNPGIVPDTTGLAWRGWAAFMTGGMSILGESVIKRVLATENPCKSTKDTIVKDLCPKNPIAASSPMVCPSAQ